ncbi:MAG TPA: hypothetical protein VFB66_20120 [Tepidisphaeraceae bacterium]|nr:hypothetical protein [Tepidisphaeraceae bacterium]
MNNTGATLALNAATGSWTVVTNGTVQGGTVATGDGVSLVGSGGVLDGVTLAGRMLVISSVQVATA